MSAARVDTETKALVAQAIAEQKNAKGFTFWDLTDQGLLDIRRQYLRMIEDNPDTAHAKIDAWLASIRWVRLVRWCLHMRYGAVDQHLGTKSWDRYRRFGDAPAYSLALEYDQLRWSYRDHPKMPKRGTNRHILDWDRLGGTPHWISTLSNTNADT